MNKEEILIVFRSNFTEGFANNQRDIILKENSLTQIFDLISDLISFASYLSSIPKPELNKIEFRTAYVIESLYFFDNTTFCDFHSSFFELFPKVKNESTKRHFAKIMADILSKDNYRTSDENYDLIAATCVDWIIKEKVRVAVQIWAIECLIVLKTKVNWVPDLLMDLLDTLSVNPSAGMKVRLKRWRTR
jgi:hypothetical protein